MKEQWKKTGFWFLMSVLSVLLIFIPCEVLLIPFCFINFICCLFTAFVATFYRMVRPYRCYCGAAIFIAMMVAADCAKEITSAEAGTFGALSAFMMLFVFLPYPLIMAAVVYIKGKSEYQESNEEEMLFEWRNLQ